jgi:TonB family protein
MAFRPISRPDPLPKNLILGPQSPDTPKLQPRFEPLDTLSKLANTLSSLGGGASSAELALDIVLNEIVQEALLATHAAGAAVGLIRDGRMVCRATTGIGGPNLGMELDEHSGLSGMALRTRQVQLCLDSETDSRVDAIVCRELGIRSILVLPILRPSAQEFDSSQVSSALGVIEVFSPYPHAFGDAETSSLMTFCSRILGLLAPASVLTEIPEIKEIQQIETPKEHSSSAALGTVETIQSSGLWANVNDHWTTILTVAVIGSAFLLGWSWGHGNSHRSRHGIPSVAASQQPPIWSGAPADKPDATSGDSSKGTEAVLERARPLAKQERSQTPSGDLVVYEKGKVIYRSKADNEADSTIVRRPVAGALSANRAVPRIVHQVEPVYPDSALRQRIAGPVEVLTLVDKSGMVEEVKVISGNPVLAEAAAAAISQWRFKPIVEDGKAVSFETRIKVEFKLPGN